jgi:hypothetical protein
MEFYVPRETSRPRLISWANKHECQENIMQKGRSGGTGDNAAGIAQVEANRMLEKATKADEC